MQMHLKRSNPEYQRLKLAFELARHPGWQQLLKPLIEKALNGKAVLVTDTASSYEEARRQGGVSALKRIYNEIEERAREFTEVVIVPEDNDPT